MQSSLKPRSEYPGRLKHRRLKHRRLAPGIVACLTLLMAWGQASACNVPVFRYALERWGTETYEDLYEVLIYHRGPVTAEQQLAIDELRMACEGDAAMINSAVELIDLAETVKPPRREVWEKQEDKSLPRVVLRYPAGTDGRTTAWTGPLNPKIIHELIQSPGRDELAKRLMRGDSIVWVLLESGDAKRDDATAKLLESRLQAIEPLMEIPDGIGDDGVDLLSDVPLHIAFSVLRVKHDAPEESQFVAMLKGVRPEMRDKEGPLVVPVFGRGRALDVLTHDQLDEGLVRSAATFLCGACSCQVKSLNPGMDMLLSADWSSIVREPSDDETLIHFATLPRAGDAADDGKPAEVEYVTIPSGDGSNGGPNVTVLDLPGEDDTTVELAAAGDAVATVSTDPADEDPQNEATAAVAEPAALDIAAIDLDAEDAAASVTPENSQRPWIWGAIALTVLLALWSGAVVMRGR